MTGHRPPQLQVEAEMKTLAQLIDGYLNDGHPKQKWGFALLVFAFGEPGDGSRINYVGNGKREDVLVALKELVARWEGRHQESGSMQ